MGEAGRGRLVSVDGEWRVRADVDGRGRRGGKILDAGIARGETIRPRSAVLGRPRAYPDGASAERRWRGVGTMHGPRLGGTREAGRACERRWSAQFGSRHLRVPSCLSRIRDTLVKYSRGGEPGLLKSNRFNINIIYPPSWAPMRDTPMQRYCSELTEKLLKSLDKEYNVSKAEGCCAVLYSRREMPHRAVSVSVRANGYRATLDPPCAVLLLPVPV